MTSPAPRGPASWAAAEPTERQEATGFGRKLSVSFDPESQRHQSTGNVTPNGQQDMGRRRSSFAERVHALRTAGGPNSLDAFARSWQRAAGFYEVVPVRQSFLYVDGGEDEQQPDYVRGEIDTSPMSQRSLLREQLAREDELQPHGDVFEDEASTSRVASQDERSPLIRERPSRVRGDSIFQIEPQLASPFGGSYGSTWGSLASRANEPAMRHAGRLFQQQQLEGVTEPDKEREPLLVKQVQEEDGKVVNVVVGQSTLQQTIFNSINVLVGVGLLALPLAMKYAGWVPGIIFLMFSAIATSYTAKLLAKCADKDSSIITFADLALVSFGKSWRLIVSGLFVVELVGACVALVVLFADSIDTLIPGYGVDMWKVVCGAILIPFGFIPLRYLSVTSIVGIGCCLSITLALLFDGFWKGDRPGSLREPAKTYLFPENWATLPIAFGLLMSPWGGHSVFPNIYRDMRHPYRYRTGVNITYTFTLVLILTMAIAGYLMFGDGVKEEITKNLVSTPGYPHWIGVAVIVIIIPIPITKVPLNARPIIASIEIPLGLDPRKMAESGMLTGRSGGCRGTLKIAIRVGCTVLFVLLAIAIPSFDTIMSLLGALACFAICIILPCSFHLKLFWDELPMWHIAMDFTLISVSTVLAAVSTVFNCIPKEKLGY